MLYIICQFSYLLIYVDNLFNLATCYMCQISEYGPVFIVYLMCFILFLYVASFYV